MKRYVSAARARTLRRKGVEVKRDKGGQYWDGNPTKATAQAVQHSDPDKQPAPNALQLELRS